ncbi:MAG: Ezrin/radixin/moesin family protein [Bacteroidota bacterium]
MRKRIFFPVSLLLVMLISVNSFGQLSKADKKKWKSEAKKYAKNPESLKQLVEDNQSLNGQVSKLQSQVKTLQSSLSDKDAQLVDAQEDAAKLRSDLAKARAEARKAAESEGDEGELKSGQRLLKGVVFKVQIGAFRNKDLSKYFENHENFGGETDGDGVQKITLGQFKDYWEADTFKKYLREMGVSDAWIVPYKDGTRVNIKDVLEGVITPEEG